MYKRRPKSSNLGIVRTIQSTQGKSENVSPNVRDSNKNRPSQPSSPKSLVSDNPDEILSDSEPAPKKSRRLGSLRGESSIVRGLSANISQVFDVGRSTQENSKSLDKSTEIYDECHTKTNENGNFQVKETIQSKFKPSSGSVSNEHKKTITERCGIGKKGTFLEDLFKAKGFLLSDGKSPNILETDQAIFIKEITTALTQNRNEHAQNVSQIIKDLEEYCSNLTLFKFAISPTETAYDCEVSRGATQDSMMRLLLHVDCLQAQVSQFLMEKLTKFVMDGTENIGDTSVITWVRLILQCFRFLNQSLSASTLNERLLDIVLATSDITIQQEVVISLPDIITDEEHHHAALELSKLIRKSSPQLLASALEALANLSLQSEVKAQVQPILMKALQKVQPEFLPIILKFLFNDCDPLFLDELINFLRNGIDISEIQGDTASIQILVFNTLRDAILSSRTLSNVWQKNISGVKSQAEHRPIDIVMLLILLSATNDPVRQRSIEAVFRNRIRNDMFTETLVIETMKSYIAVVKEYFHVTTKLAGSLLKSTEPVVIEFASKIYIGMFVNMDGLWCKWVLSELQVCIGAGGTGVVRAALSILQHLTDNYHHRVKPLGVILMLLLNKLSDLALCEVCQLMDILCNIAYSQDGTNSSSECSILQDEINILVQKQLSSSQLSVLRSGVIGCVMAIKHIASSPVNNSDSSTSENPDKGKKAIELLEILLSSTRNSVETQGLALDQLSHLLISTNNLEPSFVRKLSSLMRDNLQDSFLISFSDFVPNDEVLKSSLQFYLDDESEEGIALNLCDLVVKESSSFQERSVMGVSCLHPLLRLLRGLEMSDLSEIDALLGCAIDMPHPSNFTEFSQLTTYQQHISLHCIFHCINWFHEIINCFAFLVKKNEPEKVLIRLRTVVWMRDLLAHSLPLTMEYVPPTCYFQPLPKPKINNPEKPSKKGSKKKTKKNKNKVIENDECHLTGNENSTRLEDEEIEEPTENKTADLAKYKHYFRELDIDVWLILTQPLNLSPTPAKSGNFTPELGPSELLFLLDDYVIKLSHALTTSNKRVSFLKTCAVQNYGFENLEKFTPLHIAKNTIKLLPFLCSFLEKTVEYTKNLMAANDGVLDSTGMFIDGSAEIKQCQGKLLKIISILFSWVGFQNQANNTYLLAGLAKIASRIDGDQLKNKSKKLLVRDCINYLVQCKEYILDLVSATTLVDAAIALTHYGNDDTSFHSIISLMCEEMLHRRWYDLKGNCEKGAALNSYVNDLLGNYLSHSSDQLATIMSSLAWLSSEHQQLNEKDATLTTFPVISKLNLHILMGGLLKGLEGAIKQKLDNQISDKEQLELWSSFTQGLETLVVVIKAHDSKPNIRVFMKGCTNVLKLFLAHGMSTCTFMFKHEPTIVSHILKKLQITTRYIQNVCNFVKVSKDTSLTQFLPSIRAVMEAILLRVKSIIVLNNCADAFFMGSMKNRDLKGQEIPSQEEKIDDEESLRNEAGSESEQENENSNETDGEENEETGESVSILF